MRVDVGKLKELEAIYHGSKPVKLLHAPARMLASEVVRVAARIRSFVVPATAQTFWGRNMKVYLPEIVSLYVYRFGLFEPEFCAALCALIKPASTFFDVGAHFGFFSLLAADLGAAVHCFEPTRSTFQVLSENLEPRGARLNNVALWNEVGQLQFTDFGMASCAYNSFRGAKAGRVLQGREYTVQTLTVDEYVRRTGAAPDVIKIDAEGAEYEIIEGMRDTMARFRPLISIEVSDSFAEGSNRFSREPIELAMRLGYTAMDFREGRLQPHQLRERYTWDSVFLVPP